MDLGCSRKPGGARAEKSADEVRATVEALADRFAREASEQAELIVLRVGSGVNVVNKSSHALRSVGVAPVGDAFDWNRLAQVGDFDPLRTGAANVEELYPDWPSSVSVLVYWLNDEYHRRLDVFPVIDASSAELAALRHPDTP
jgi:hypothetical protein